MRKLLFAICLLLVASPAFGATWYACAGSKNINSVSGGTTSDVWYSAEACTGGSYYAWTATFDDGLNAGDILEANGQTALSINVNPGATGKKVHLKTLSGGGFTYAVASLSAITINADVTAGTTDCIAVSGAGGGETPELTIVGNITGGGTAAKSGVSDSTTGASTNVVITGSLTGGGAAAAYGYRKSGASGTVTITGSSTGSAAAAGLFLSAASTATINGDCTGATAADIPGCEASSTGAITVTGNIVNAERGAGVHGNIIWSPSSAQKYIKFLGSGTAIYASSGLGSDAGGTQVAAANTAAEISTGKYFVKKDDGVYTQGTKSSSGGGGGAWGF